MSRFLPVHVLTKSPTPSRYPVIAAFALDASPPAGRPLDSKSSTISKTLSVSPITSATAELSINCSLSVVSRALFIVFILFYSFIPFANPSKKQVSAIL